MVDVLFVTWNRFEFTRESFAALVANTSWDLVQRLVVLDDGSVDETMAYLHEAVQTVPAEVTLRHGRLGGPVAAMNWYLDHASPEADMFAKVDNDTIVCPGWLDELARVMGEHPEVDILGTEPWIGAVSRTPDPARTVRTARHIGGKGLIRRAAFGDRRMVARGYFGFTGWQTEHEDVVKAWIEPDMPVFGLDQLPIGRWRALTDRYQAIEWQRRWPEYDQASHAYWDWWIEQDPARGADA